MFFYTACFYSVLPWIFLRLLWRSRQQSGYRKNWAERLGYCPFKLKACIWVHVVSMGETIAAAPLIRALKQAYPQWPVVITNMTPTGRAQVVKLFGEDTLKCYIPYDIPFAVNTFLNRIQPKIAIILETELWPNTILACARRKIPLLILNARLSEKSQRGYQRILPLTKKILSAITHIGAQASYDADRFVTLGLPVDKITVTGNLKFDLVLPNIEIQTLHKNFGLRSHIWIAASTHPGEEDIILEAHREILKKYPEALLILVPRHPDRFPSVFSNVQASGFSVIKRSQRLNCEDNIQVYLGDTMGELLYMYAVSQVAFIGGSLIERGGHNMLEAAALKKPVLSGPSVYNFTEVSQLLLQAGGMQIVTNTKALVASILNFFDHPDIQKNTGEKAYQVFIQNKGALEKQLKLIKDFLQMMS